MDCFYYIKISCGLSHSEELTEIMWSEHPLGVEENRINGSVVYTAYFVVQESVNNLRDKIDKISYYRIEEIGNIEREDWVKQWMRRMKPKRIGRNIIIVYDIGKKRREYKSKIILKIVPALAFGTGFHESTILCLKELDATDVKNKCVLDLGCGTGILAILAVKKGAKKAIALDIEEDAIKETKRNSFYNRVDTKIEAVVGSINCLGDVKFDVVISNLFKGIILDNMELIIDKLKEGGKWIFSGIIDKEKGEIEQKLKLFEGKKKWHRKNEWLCCSFIKG